ncbi:hypothetical protein AVEN_184084-1 [Araneus ventricosus]|uniref:Uncharacterized protein n=1 Tax=Araneus ventricosus TaxID=182803 RepID=A0A4Y2CZV5_ARAVE|nr:hypothetical protein AVEN_184084-1 [Araneus ventricosus]
MLRHILGHWKAHRRKPSLLPEDIESPNHSDDPSKVNPIFEDSEGSIASSGRNDTESPTGDRRSTTGIDLDLVDVSVPVDTQESNAIEENPDDVINQINLVLDNSLLNEKESSDEQINNTPELKRKDTKDLSNTVTETTENKNMVTEKSEPEENKPRMSRLHQIVKSHPELKRELTSDIKILQDLPSSKNKASIPKPREKSETEKIQEQKATAAVSAKTEKTSEQIAIPSTSTGITSDSFKTSNSTPVLDTNTNTPSTSTANVNESVVPNKESNASSAVAVDSNKPAISNVEPVTDSKQKSKFKKRAIDELIKKFQGSNSEDSTPIQKVPSFLHSSNKKEVPEESKETKESQASAASKEQEKESLSKIFNFPPPPPVEPKRNKSQKVENSSKETKIASSEVVSKINSNFILKEAKTRTDSSLSRNKTVVSSHAGGDAATNKPIGSENAKETESGVKKVTDVATAKTTSSTQPKNASNEPVVKKEKDSVKESTSTSLKEKISSPNKTDSKLPKETKSDEITPGPSEKQSSSNATTKSTSETKTQNVQKAKENLAKSSRSPEAKRKASTSKKSTADTKETDVTKSHSEDSGITRGDQISSDVSPDGPKAEPQKEKEVETTPAKRNSRERRTMQSRNKNCKRCKRHSYDGEAPLKRSLCDEYYDVLTGLHRSHKSKYSDSWTSDLSREERDLIRRLRNKRDTFRSNGPTGKVRHSRRVKNLENGYFHRHHPIRRSVSDESTVNGSSMCSCDDCWLFLVKDYAYGRASLRGITPDKVVCTCRSGRPEMLGRRVKFRSDTIPEASPSERTATSPPIPEETIKKEDATDTRSTSNLSTVSQDSVLRNGKLPDKASKKGKGVKEPTYRLVTPWELEEWDLAMKRHLLKKRRKRARYMGFMALAMVVFVGLVVAILMVYLRRKVL